MSDDSIDDRIAPRLNIDATIFIEAGIRAHPKDTGKIGICSSHDISETGMQVVLDQRIGKGRIVRACLDINKYDLIFVIAKVVWQSHSSGAFHHGLSLLETQGTDIKKWRSTIRQLSG